MIQEEKNSLNKIQKWMQNALLNPTENSNESIEALIRPSKKMTAHQHLAIYQRSYVARLRECMSKQFEVLAFALGEKLFQQFVDQYLQTYPSQSYSLADLGKQFHIYLQETRPDRDADEKEDWPDFLIELAQLEYNIQIIFDEKNEEKYQRATLSTSDESLKLIPVFHLFEFQFPVNYFFQSFKRGEEPNLPFEKKSWCAIYRFNYRVAMQGLNFWQYKFLKYVEKNKNVNRSLEKIAIESNSSFSEIKNFWEHWRKVWINEGMIVQSEK